VGEPTPPPGNSECHQLDHDDIASNAINQSNPFPINNRQASLHSVRAQLLLHAQIISFTSRGKKKTKKKALNELNRFQSAPN